MTRLLTFLAMLAAPAGAQTLDDIVQLEVLPGWQTPTGAQMAGLRIQLAPGWKTYWRAPGDAGIPPQLTLDAGTGVAHARFLWPVPEVFDQNGMRSIGYHDAVVIPLEVTPNGAGTMRLAGTLEIGICEEICIPARLPFNTDLPSDGERDPAIVAALVNRPMTAAEAGVTDVACALTPANVGMTITASLSLPQLDGPETVVIETHDNGLWVSETDVTRDGNRLTATADMVHMIDDAFAVDRAGLRITVIGGRQAVDIRGCPAG